MGKGSRGCLRGLWVFYVGKILLKLPNVYVFVSTGSSSGIDDISWATDRLKNVPYSMFENITLHTSICFFNKSATSLT